MPEETNLEVLQKKKQALEEIIGQENLQKIKKAEKWGSVIGALTFSAFAYPTFKYIARPIAQSLGPPPSFPKEEEIFTTSAVAIISILAGYFSGKEMSRESEINRLERKNPDKADKIRELNALHYEIKTKNVDAKFNKMNKIVTKGFAYALRTGAYITGTLETLVGSMLAIAPLSCITNPPQSDTNFVEYGVTNTLAFLLGAGAFVDGIYTLKKGERPFHLLMNGTDKVIGKLIGMKEIVPKYSSLMKEAESISVK